MLDKHKNLNVIDLWMLAIYERILAWKIYF